MQFKRSAMRQVLVAFGNRAYMAFRERFCCGLDVRCEVADVPAVTGVQAGQGVVVRTAGRAGR